MSVMRFTIRAPDHSNEYVNPSSEAPTVTRFIGWPSIDRFNTPWLKAGETASISLVMMNLRDLTGVEVVLTFDPALLEAVDVGPGTLLTLSAANPAAASAAA